MDKVKKFIINKIAIKGHSLVKEKGYKYLLWLVFLLIAFILVGERYIYFFVALVLLPSISVLSYFLFWHYWLYDRLSEKVIIPQDLKIFDDLSDSNIKQFAGFIHTVAGFPAYKNTRVNYFRNKNMFLQYIKEEIAKTKKNVFVQINKKDFSEVLPLLSFEDKTIDLKVIEQESYNYLTSKISYVIIDNNSAYIFGKDICVSLRGDAVYSMTVLFFNTWDYIYGSDTDVTEYHPTINYLEEKGLIQPFYIKPDSNEHIIHSLFFKALIDSKNYVYIETPQINFEPGLVKALIIAAQNGIEIIIVTKKQKLLHLPRAKYILNILDEYGIEFYFTEKNIITNKLISDDYICVLHMSESAVSSFSAEYSCGLFISDINIISELKNEYLQSLSKIRGTENV